MSGSYKKLLRSAVKSFFSYLLIFTLFSMQCKSTGLENPPGVILENELIELRLGEHNLVHVRVTYRYRGRISSLKRLAFPETEWFKLEKFRANWGGKDLKVEYRKAPPGHSFHIGSGEFTGIYLYDVPPLDSGHQTSINEYYYTAPYYGPGTKSDEPEGYYVEYILVTGATWKGPIGRLDVVFNTGRVRCTDLKHLSNSYRGNCMPDGTWRFTALNLEPDKNIRLLLPLER